MAASASANIDFDNSIFEVESQAVELVPQASPSPPTWRERAKNFGGKICGGLNRVRESWLFRAMLVVGLVSTAVNSYYADIQLKKAYGDIDALVEGHLLLVEHMDFLESEVSGLSVTATPAIPPDAGKDRDMDVVAVHAALRSALVNIEQINEHGINGVQPYMSGRDFVALMSVMNDKTTLSLQPSLPSLDFLYYMHNLTDLSLGGVVDGVDAWPLSSPRNLSVLTLKSGCDGMVNFQATMDAILSDKARDVVITLPPQLFSRLTDDQRDDNRVKYSST